jgi:CRP-like cAMP-binding protein
MQESIKDMFSIHFSMLKEELGEINTETLLKSMTLLELPAGRNVTRYRMPVDSTYFIVGGSVDVTVDEEKGIITLEHSLGHGHLLGEVSALSGDYLASATVTTVTPSRFLRLRHQALEELLTSNQDISTILLRYFVLMLSDRLRKAYQLESSFVLSNA